MGHLSNPQITVLALWSYGIVLAKSCGLTRVALTLADQFAGKETNFRQQLREWCWDRKDKQGSQRREWVVRHNFAPLLKWILTLWASDDHRLVLALDATSLKQLFVVLTISVVYRGSAMPVAWAILPAAQKGAWKEPWLTLLADLQGSTPAEWLVIVTADRGLYARWLFEAIQACGWHPFLRINLCCRYRPKGAAEFRPMAQLLPAPGSQWSGHVTCFVAKPVEATLLASWGTAHREPWLILTDLPPTRASATWYGMRSWIEAGFKDLKRDGWQWQQTRMTDPARAARLWLALAVASLWVINLGGDTDAHLPIANLAQLPPSHIARRTHTLSTKPRKISCFARGLSRLLAMLLHQHPIQLCPFIPEPWT